MVTETTMDQKTESLLTPVIAERWSPNAFDPARPVEPEKLDALFEALRWAPSCYNEQPWRLLVTWRGDGGAYEKLFECLADGNKPWARTAPMLMLSLAKRTFSANGKPNRWAGYDTGQAVSALLAQATAMGLYAHQMGGYDPDAARTAFRIPDDYESIAAIALGYRGDPAQLPADRPEKDPAGRERRGLDELVFAGTWGRNFD
ncbi:MAG: nitroreductase family protein [Gammaproteobacteria bacterium]|nr:nitroreductase family protein [Gammaproteobacteria bacterium]NNL99994.1 nitroreductase family protein [Gammaproteobacteria bacterium]